jgi:hypothetical protein
MTSAGDAALQDEYREAIRRRVCSVCLDSRDDGSCGLSGRVCALESHLPQLVAILTSLDSPSLDDYTAAVRAQVCSRCESRQPQGACQLREAAVCALDAYLPLVLEAIEEVHSRRRSHA